MRISLAVAGVLAILVLAGCTSDEGQVPHQSTSLRDRAEAANNALNAGNWLDYYKFTSHRSRALCEPEQFTIYMETRMDKLRSSMGIEEGEPLEWRITKVTESLAKGRVYHDILYKGEPIDLGGDDEGTRWAFLREIEKAESLRIWWQEDENWKEGCP